MMQRKAIALLITLLFIMLITISVGAGLKQLNQASGYVEDEKFLFQSSVILNDTLDFLKNSQELNDINSSDDFSAFLAQTSFIPFQSHNIKITIKISSARSKFNVNNLMDNKVPNIKRINILKEYFANHMISSSFVDILLDSMGGIKEDLSYESSIFEEKPELFRDYISSYKHFSELKDFYKSYYNDDSLKNIDFKNLFYFTNDKEYKVDLNYATAEVWEMMIGCDKAKAIELSEGSYDSFDDLGLNKKEINVLKYKFKTSFFEPYIYVVINIEQNKNNAIISFEYDIKKKKGSNFVYEI